SGWMTSRRCSAAAAAASFGLTAGDCADANPALNANTAASAIAPHRLDRLTLAPWRRSTNPLVFVLALVARVDRELPVLLVAAPGLARPRCLVRLALVGALLVLDHLRPLAAAGEPEPRPKPAPADACAP